MNVASFFFHLHFKYITDTHETLCALHLEKTYLIKRTVSGMVWLGNTCKTHE